MFFFRVIHRKNIAKYWGSRLVRRPLCRATFTSSCPWTFDLEALFVKNSKLRLFDT